MKRASLEPSPKYPLLFKSTDEEPEKMALSLRKFEKKRTLSTDIQTTATFSKGLGNAMVVVKTRPRFLGGQYSSRITEKAKAKYLADGQLHGTTDRKVIEEDCKHVFAEKYSMIRTEKKLKALEKDFTKQLEREFLTQVREGKKEKDELKRQGTLDR